MAFDAWRNLELERTLEDRSLIEGRCLETKNVRSGRDVNKVLELEENLEVQLLHFVDE